jgi:predicted RNA-binding protein YlxR (DUF448 family)
VGCRRVGDPATLVRVSLDTDGEPQLGPGPGRGAWLCAPGALACLDAALHRRALDRALRAPVTAHAADTLRARLEALNG